MIPHGRPTRLNPAKPSPPTRVLTRWWAARVERSNPALCRRRRRDELALSFFLSHFLPSCAVSDQLKAAPSQAVLRRLEIAARLGSERSSSGRRKAQQATAAAGEEGATRAARDSGRAASPSAESARQSAPTVTQRSPREQELDEQNEKLRSEVRVLRAQKQAVAQEVHRLEGMPRPPRSDELAKLQQHASKSFLRGGGPISHSLTHD